jgi:hypothetical protein
VRLNSKIGDAHLKCIKNRNKLSVFFSQDSVFKGRKSKVILCSNFFVLFLISHLMLLFPSLTVYAADDPFNKMRDEVVSYFKPVTGTITMVEGKKVVVNLGTKDSVKPGMRFSILREEAPFRHPVTKEPLGKLESNVGSIEIKEVDIDSSIGTLIEGDAEKGDMARISGIKVNMLFCQSKNIDWYLADSYYRSLKETGRFNMIDTGVDTDDPSKVLEEAKKLNAEVALLLTSKTADTNTIFTQSLFWVSDGLKFSKIDTNIDVAYAKEQKFGEEFFALHKEDALLKFELPSGMKLVTISDINGDGENEIILSTGEDVKAYTPSVELQPALGGVQIKGSGQDDYIWLDSIDLNRNGRDELIITSMKRKEVTSYIYELSGPEFVLMYKDNVFMRRMGNRLIAQNYSQTEGYDGSVYEILWEGEYKKGGKIKLPEGVNIYDFIYIDDPQTGRLILAYDEKGLLNLYDNNGMKIWSSKTDTGGFLTKFKKAAPTVMVDRGEWAVKDRLFLRKKEVLFVKRVPLLRLIKGFGYKSSQIKSLWWNGLSMDEGVLIDNISGSILDYDVTGGKVIVLVSPMFGIKAGNILQGKNPVKTMLYIYSIKGR